MPPVEFEPTIAAGERPQTYALDRAATGIGKIFWLPLQIFLYFSNKSPGAVPDTEDNVIHCLNWYNILEERESVQFV